MKNLVYVNWKITAQLRNCAKIILTTKAPIYIKYNAGLCRATVCFCAANNEGDGC